MIRFLAMAMLPLSLCGCGASQSEHRIRGVLDAQVRAWNAGDIEGFMQGYWKSDELVFESPNAQTRGWQATLDRYRQRYPTREKMGHLQFSKLVVRSTGDETAEVTGRYVVKTVEGALTGSFILDMRRMNDQWVIVKDHTTPDEQPH